MSGVTSDPVLRTEPVTGLPVETESDSDVVGGGILASRPASGTEIGDLYIVADAPLGIHRIDRWNGSAWITLIDFRDPNIAVNDGPSHFTGLFEETLPLANPFPTSEIWWTDSGKTIKVIEVTTTYNGNKTVNTEEFKVYHADGTLRKTVLDTYTYSGVFVKDRTRTIT